MGTLLVFVPNTIVHEPPSFLLGFSKEDPRFDCRSVYVLGTQPFEKSCDSLQSISDQIVGTCSSKLGKSFKVSKIDPQDIWLTIRCLEKDITLQNCVISKKPQPLNSCIVIKYDLHSLMKSELFLCPDFKNKHEIDHFKIIANNLQIKHDRDFISSKYYDFYINTILVIFALIHIVLDKGSFILQYSTLISHLKSYVYSILWAGETCKKKRYINLKVGNYLMSMVLDILAGFIVYFMLNRWKSADEMFDSLSLSTKVVIDSINDLVKSLMGSPAGLKLNQPLSNLLGSLVLYYLEIWWAFLSLVRPILELAFLILIKIGFLGFTFQIAVFSDILAIVSFHVYCIYIYAARLYEIQAKGLYSLSRLVLGRKRNPEPGKVDSCPYSTEELLIGTISFAVLLFLLPTTLVYYVVFTGMRLGVIVISGLLNYTIYFIQTMPVYTTVLWLFFPCYTATIVKLTPSTGTLNTEHGSLIAKSTNASWLETIKKCVPDVLKPPHTVPIGQTMWKVASGKLI
uniref:Phosphatidylinositol N-acetylglucosaminyltransferase subunit Q n=1 Tax=Riptortus pedestris TaxID=329032 RepID=R4WDW8_RIPPE|nr:hypothetical protein [Riptortus pedestris]